MTANFPAEQPTSPPGAEPIDARAEERLATSSQTAALCRDGRRRLVRLINLSRAGAMIANCDALQTGERVTLQLIDHGEVEADVRWVRDGRAGLHFARPLE